MADDAPTSLQFKALAEQVAGLHAECDRNRRLQIDLAMAVLGAIKCLSNADHQATLASMALFKKDFEGVEAALDLMLEHHIEASNQIGQLAEKLRKND